jgi:hypothetical protein
LSFRVFLSFTSELKDFPAPRSFVAAAQDALVRAGYAVANMEHFSAREEPPAAVCRDEVLLSDVYIGLIGLRYGSRVRDQPEMSYTELEFDIATEAGRPRLIFMLDENADLPIPPARLNDTDGDGRARQQRFRQRLADAGLTIVKVATPDQLKFEVYDAVRRRMDVGRLGVSGGAASLPSQRLPIGRETEIGLLVASWLAAQPEPVAVLGAAGIGKSAICLAALQDDRVRDRFGSRRWFVRCDGANSAQAMLSALAVKLGVIAGGPMEGGVPPGEGLADRVFTVLGARPGVIVLDNFETPWRDDALAVEELLGIVGTLPEVRLAVTIRGMARPAVLPWLIATVGQLPLPAARQMFLTIAGRELESDPDLDALLRELDGMPLAVELFGHVAQGEPDLMGLVPRWRRERIDLLERMGGEQRELSVVASVEASVKASSMTDPARHLLAVLGMLPNGIARTDIDALMPGDGLAATTVLQQRLGLAFYESGRLRVLAPVRYYAESRCLPRPKDLAHMIEYYAVMAAAMEAPVYGREITARLDAEIGNVTGVLKRSVDMIRADDVRLAIGTNELVNGLCGLVKYWILTRTVESRLIADAYKVLDARCTDWQRGRLSRAIADLALARSDYGSAKVRYAHALILFQQAQDVLGEANCKRGFGDISLAQSDYDAAISAYLEALPLYRRAESLPGEANCIKGLGNIAFERFEFESALT